MPSAICREIFACMQGKSVSSESLLIRPGDQASRRVKLEGFPGVLELRRSSCRYEYAALGSCKCTLRVFA